MNESGLTILELMEAIEMADISIQATSVYELKIPIYKQKASLESELVERKTEIVKTFREALLNLEEDYIHGNFSACKVIARNYKRYCGEFFQNGIYRAFEPSTLEILIARTEASIEMTKYIGVISELSDALDYLKKGLADMGEDFEKEKEKRYYVTYEDVLKLKEQRELEEAQQIIDMRGQILSDIFKTIHNNMDEFTDGDNHNSITLSSWNSFLDVDYDFYREELLKAGWSLDRISLIQKKYTYSISPYVEKVKKPSLIEIIKGFFK